MKRSRFIIILGTLAILVIGGVSLALLQKEEQLPPPPAELNAVLLPEYRTVTPFQLTDGDGQPFDLSRLKGKWSFIFFGYTHCPDICPTTLATLRMVAKNLQQTPPYYQNSQFLFISVDPKRDKPANLKQFVSYFHPDFLAATGVKTEIDNLAKQLGAVYMFDGDTNSDDYIVNHSATVVLIDPQGRWVARFNPPHKASEIAEQFRRLRDYFQQK
jgi:protein SCO1